MPEEILDMSLVDRFSLAGLLAVPLLLGTGPAFASETGNGRCTYNDLTEGQKEKGVVFLLPNCVPVFRSEDGHRFVAVERSGKGRQGGLRYFAIEIVGEVGEGAESSGSPTDAVLQADEVRNPDPSAGSSSVLDKDRIGLADLAHFYFLAPLGTGWWRLGIFRFTEAGTVEWKKADDLAPDGREIHDGYLWVYDYQPQLGYKKILPVINGQVRKPRIVGIPTRATLELTDP
jgi:hypothetical protein